MPNKVTVKEGSSTPLLDARQREIDLLWKSFERQKHIIIMEEMDRDADMYPDEDGVYYEDYVNHWRVEKLVDETYAAEDEIYTRYGYE